VEENIPVKNMNVVGRIRGQKLSVQVGASGDSGFGEISRGISPANKTTAIRLEILETTASFKLGLITYVVIRRHNSSSVDNKKKSDRSGMATQATTCIRDVKPKPQGLKRKCLASKA
jgi:hypothetical protein